MLNSIGCTTSQPNAAKSGSYTLAPQSPGRFARQRPTAACCIMSCLVAQRFKPLWAPSTDLRVSTRPGSTVKRGLRIACVQPACQGSQARGAIVLWFSEKPSIENEKRFEDDGLSMRLKRQTARVSCLHKLSDRRASSRDAPCQLRPKITSRRSEPSDATA